MKKIDALVKPLTQTALVGDGYYIASLILDWDRIVGTQLSTISRPEKIIFPRTKRFFEDHAPGVLHLQISHSAYAMELTFQQEMIIERINIYFGKNVVDSIILKHGGKAFKQPNFEQNHPITTNQVSADIFKAVNKINDPELQQALLSLAKHIKF